MVIELFTAGAGDDTPHPKKWAYAGGWCAVIYEGRKRKILTGGEPDTTKSRMQLLAIVSGLEALKEPSVVDLKCDSGRICAAIQQKQIDAPHKYPQPTRRAAFVCLCA